MNNIPQINFNKKQNIGFELISLEKLIIKLNKPINHNPFLPHRLNFFAILIISDGEVNHSVDLKNYHLRAGDVMVISKGQIHAFDQNSQYKGYLVLFTEAFMQKYIAQSTIIKVTHLYNYFIGQEIISNPDNNQMMIETIKNELNIPSPSLPNIIGALLSIYLLRLNDNNINSTMQIDNRSLKLFNAFKTLVEERFTKTRNAKVFASIMSISYKHLNEVCKIIVNMTAKAFIDNYVTLEAKRKLITTSLSVKEISFSLGFDEPTNFLKYFKRQTNLSPAEFRKKLL